VPISWDEAFDIIGAKMQEIRAKGLVNEHGYPRAAASFGGGGIPTYYMGTFPAFLAAWGPVDFSFGSGQGVSCTHSEHLYGELWHRAFTVCPDTPSCNYVLSFGANIEASGGVVGAWRHGVARERGMKRIQFEPHLSVTGAASAEWVPIKPKTDAAFLFSLIHVLLHEMPREVARRPFLKHHTGSPYLIGPNGFYLRDPATKKPLLWDLKRNAPCSFDTPDTDPALDGLHARRHRGRRRRSRCGRTGITAETAFGKLIARVQPYTPEWAEKTCDVREGTVRRIAAEYVEHAQVGATVEIDGEILPYRPVSIQFGRTVNNGWGAYECCWARTLMACLIGGLEVPGGTLGTTVRLNRPATTRQASVKINEDGFMYYPMNPTDKANWAAQAEGAQCPRHHGAAVGEFALEHGARPDPFLLDVPEGVAGELAQGHRARHLVLLPHQPLDLLLGHQGARPSASPSSPSSSPSPTTATRPTTWRTCCCPSAPTSRAPS
jgi:phenylacetyl-CoA:acceptor oxidoreductase